MEARASTSGHVELCCVYTCFLGECVLLSPSADVHTVGRISANISLIHKQKLIMHGESMGMLVYFIKIISNSNRHLC